MLISDAYCMIKNIQAYLNSAQDLIREKISCTTYNSFITHINNKNEQIFVKTKQRHLNKINRLINKQNYHNNENTKTTSTPNWTENLTDCVIPDKIAQVLNLGPNFAIQIENSKQIPTNDIICNIELGISHVTSHDKEQIRAKTCNILTNFKQKLINNHEKKNSLSGKVKETQEFLKKHPEI